MPARPYVYGVPPVCQGLPVCLQHACELTQMINCIALLGLTGEAEELDRRRRKKLGYERADMNRPGGRSVHLAGTTGGLSETRPLELPWVLGGGLSMGGAPTHHTPGRVKAVAVSGDVGTVVQSEKQAWGPRTGACLLG